MDVFERYGPETQHQMKFTYACPSDLASERTSGTEDMKKEKECLSRQLGI